MDDINNLLMATEIVLAILEWRSVFYGSAILVKYSLPTVIQFIFQVSGQIQAILLLLLMVIADELPLGRATGQWDRGK